MSAVVFLELSKDCLFVEVLRRRWDVCSVSCDDRGTKDLVHFVNIPIVGEGVLRAPFMCSHTHQSHSSV